MNAYAPPGAGVARSIEEAMEAAYVELQQAVAHVDAVVVPKIRKESSTALKTLAYEIDRFANWIGGPATGENPRQ